MRGYASTELFTKKDKWILETAQLIVAGLPDPPKGVEWRCHELARAIAVPLPGVLVVDGTHKRVDHSWIAYRNEEHSLRILDVYAIGELPQVKLVHASFPLNDRAYQPSQLPRGDIRKDVLNDLLTAVADILLETETIGRGRPCAACWRARSEHTDGHSDHDYKAPK